MYQFAITLQCISIFALFVECWVVFIKWKNVLHAYLFLSCAATLVNNIGYLLEITSQTGESYFTALRFAYLGRVWIPFALFMFIAELTGVKISGLIKGTLAMVSMAVYAVVFTTESTGLFYSKFEFSMRGRFSNFHHYNAAGHHLWLVILGCYIAVGLKFLITAMYREKNPVALKRLQMVVTASLTESIFLMIQMLRLHPVTYVYDVTMLGFPVGVVFIFIAILRYKLLNMEALAKEHAIDELAEGIVAADDNGEVIFYNKTALVLFPDLAGNSRGTVEVLKDAAERSVPMRLQGRIYRPDKNVLTQQGRAKARENGHAGLQPDRLEKPETGERGDTAPVQEKSGRSRGTGLKREGGAEQSGGKRGVGTEPEKSGRGYESGSRKRSFVPQWIREIPELDVEEGITYCGSEENYLSILDIF